MENKKTHIDDLFRDKLGSYSERPPVGSWNNMDAKLDLLGGGIPTTAATSSFSLASHIGMVSLIAVLGTSFVQKFINNDSKSKIDTISKLDAHNSIKDVDGVSESRSITPVAMNENDKDDDGNRDLDNSEIGTLAGSGNGESQLSENEDIATDNRRKSSRSEVLKAADASGGTSKVIGAVSSGNSMVVASTSTTGTKGDAKKPAPEVLNEVNEYNGNVNEVVGKNANEHAAVDVNRKPDARVPEIAAKVLDNPKAKPGFSRWGVGVKAGYERGFDKSGSTKYLVSPYVEYKITPKFAIMVQPAIKYAQAPNRIIGDAQTYYDVKSDGNVSDNGSNTSVKVEGSTVVTYYNAKYRYTQVYDSIVKTNTYGGAYMEYELPVLAKYNVTEKLALYGGVNMIYSQMKGVKENTQIISGLINSKDTMISSTSGMTPAPAIGQVLTYSGAQFSDYNGPLYPATQENSLRFGAMLGFSYEYSDRWLLDALVQKNPAPRDVRGGVNINAPLSSAYFRLAIGYRIAK